MRSTIRASSTGGWAREEGGVVRQGRGAARPRSGAGRGKRHLAEAVVVAVGLAVRRDVDQLAVRAPPSNAARRRRRSASPRAEEPVERHRVGDRPVVEEERERPARRQLGAVGAPRVERAAPASPVSAGLADARGLARGEDGEADTLLGEHLERLAVDGGLGQPHARRLAAEAVPEVRDAPAHLRDACRAGCRAAGSRGRRPARSRCRVRGPRGSPGRPRGSPRRRRALPPPARRGAWDRR